MPQPMPMIASRLYNVPLLITPDKLQAIMSVLSVKGLQVDEQSLQQLVTAALTPSATRPAARAPRPGAGNIAVIPVIGSLAHRGSRSGSGMRSYAGIKADMSHALFDDDTIGGLMLDVDTHGGEAAALFAFAEWIRSCRGVKPIFAHANESAYSAGYGILSAAERVFVSKSSGVGSIGVIMQHVNQAKRNKKNGDQVTYIFSGAQKADGNPHQALPPEVLAKLQARIHTMRDQFGDLVDTNRNLKPGTALNTEACLYFGQEAVGAGLADAVATWEEALAELGSTIKSKRGTTMNTQQRMQTLIDSNDDAHAALAALGFVPQDQAATQGKIDQAVAEATTLAIATATTSTLANAGNIVDMCAMGNLNLAAAAQLIKEGKSVEEAKTIILAEKAALDGKGPLQSTHTGQNADTNTFVSFVEQQVAQA